MDLRNKVISAVHVKLDNCEAFTHACISHPIISNYPEVHHSQVRNIVRDLWASGEMVASDGTDYRRATISVYPGGKKRSAFCYYPDNGYDPETFSETNRILTRSPTSKKEDDIFDDFYEDGRDVEMDSEL